MNENSYNLTLEYNKELIKKSVLFFWWKTTGFLFFFAMFITFVSFVFLLLSGNSSWITGLIGTVLFFAVLIVTLLFYSHYINGMKKLKSMGQPIAQITLRDHDFTITSGAGTNILPWSSVTEIWKSETFWLLLFAKNSFFTLPLQNVPKETQDFILSKIRPLKC
jgi:hypothetical protein